CEWLWESMAGPNYDWQSLLSTKFCEDLSSCVVIHCVYGLAQLVAAVLVALALQESGMKYEDAIKQKCRGVINNEQLSYLETYRPKMRLRFKNPHHHNALLLN
uniref:Protein tyrosine phosphatase type IVA 3 n=1 Tax=Callorhinchus milii TaxID=7868 RepID=A0A4W3HI18_CALMI